MQVAKEENVIVQMWSMSFALPLRCNSLCCHFSNPRAYLNTRPTQDLLATDIACQTHPLAWWCASFFSLTSPALHPLLLHTFYSVPIFQYRRRRSNGGKQVVRSGHPFPNHCLSWPHMDSVGFMVWGPHGRASIPPACHVKASVHGSNVIATMVSRRIPIPSISVYSALPPTQAFNWLIIIKLSSSTTRASREWSSDKWGCLYCLQFFFELMAWHKSCAQQPRNELMGTAVHSDSFVAWEEIKVVREV